VWSFRRPALAAHVGRTVEWLIARVVDLAKFFYTKACNFSKPASVRSVALSQAALEFHNMVVSSVSEGHAICYTDGSALTNPGPCGAGVSVFFQN